MAERVRAWLLERIRDFVLWVVTEGRYEPPRR